MYDGIVLQNPMNNPFITPANDKNLLGFGWLAHRRWVIISWYLNAQVIFTYSELDTESLLMKIHCVWYTE